MVTSVKQVMSRFFWFFIFLFLVNGEWSAQYFHLPKNHLNDPDMPDWAVKMYQDNPNAFEVKRLYETYYSNHAFVKTEHTQYYKRWVNAIQSRVDVDGRITHSMELNAGNRGGGNLWTYCGPEVHLAADGTETEISEQANVYCHDRSISNTSILFCGTESGGVYKSTDGGAQWSHVTHNYPIGGVSAIKIHPLNADVAIFSAANDLWKTTDGGLTWSVIGQASFISQNIAAWEIIFHPTNPNIVFAATNQGLFKSTDAGTNWSEVLPNECMTVNFQPGNPNVVFTVHFETSLGYCKFYRSDDGGDNFVMYDNGWFEELPGYTNVECLGGHMAVTEADPNKIYVLLTGYGTYDAGVELNGWIGTYVSSDGGFTWSHPHGLIGTPYNIDTHPNLMNFSADDGTYTQIHYNTTIVASQLDPNKILIGGLNLWKSEDGGATYQGVAGYIGGLPYFHVDQQELRIYKISDTEEVIWASNDGGINVSNDFLNTYSARNRGIRAVNLWGYDQGWNEDIMVGGRYHNGNMGYHENYGQGNYLALGGGEAPTGYVNYSDENKTYFSDIQGRVLPETVQENPSGFSISIYPNESYWYNESSRILFSSVYFNNAYLGNANKLYYTTNGSSFMELYAFGSNENDKVLWMEQCYQEPDILYVQQRVGNTSKLWRSSNGGFSFEAITLPINQNNMCFTVGATSQEIWLTFPNASNIQRVWRSIDGGVNWSNYTGGSVLGNGRPWAIAHALGTNGGVYIATNDGRVLYRNTTMSDWMEYSAGLPVNTEAMRLVPFYRDQKIRLATWNLGVWEAPLMEPSSMLVDFAAESRSFFCPGDEVHFVDHSVVPIGATYAWTFSGATPATSTAQNPTVVYNTTGSFDVTLTVTFNGQSISKSKTQYIISSESTAQIAEDFESGAISPDWQLAHPTGGGFNWVITQECSAYGAGNFSMKFDNYWIDAQGNRDEIWLDKINVVNGSLEFDVAYAEYGVPYSDTLAVLLSADCGVTWNELWVKGGDDLATAPDNTNAFIPAASEWRHETIDLTAFDGGEVIIAFQNRGRYGNQLYVDNINVQTNFSVEDADNSKWMCYPNPATDRLWLESDQIKIASKWALTDLLGREIWVPMNIQAGKMEVLTSSLPAGQYIIRCVDNVSLSKIQFQKQ